MAKSVQLPANPAEVLGNSKYYTKGGLEAVFRRWRETSDGDVGLEIADIAERLAEQTAEYAENLREFAMRKRIEAVGIRGSSMKRKGQFAEAEACLRQALGMAGDQYPVERGDCLRRLAYIRFNQMRYDEALKLAEQALVIFERAGAEHQYGEAVLVKGIIYGLMERSGEAIREFAESLCHLSPRQCHVTYYAAIHNLLVDVVKAKEAESVRRVAGLLRWARQALPRGFEEARIKLQWVEGIGDIRFGSDIKAVETLANVAEMLEEHGTPHDRMIIAFDLAQAYFVAGDYHRTAQALASGLDIMRRSEGMNPDAVKSVERCLETIGRKTDREEPWSIRHVVIGHRLKHSCG